LTGRRLRGKAHRPGRAQTVVIDERLLGFQQAFFLRQTKLESRFAELIRASVSERI
jgi:hypothetical protein